MKILYTGLIALLILSCEKPFTPSVVSDLDSLFSKESFNGTIVIGNKKGIIFQKAYGIADRTWNLPMQTDNKFDIASINKSFIAGLILKAVQENNLKLSDRLADLLPGYDFPYSITLHHMLSHTSGLPDYDAVEKKLSANGFTRFKRMHFEPDEYVKFISELDRLGEAGMQFYYSNFSYHLLAIILEKTYGMDFPTLFKEKLTISLGLNDTFSSTNNEEIKPQLVTGYTGTNDFVKNNFIDLALGRRIFSTSKDLYTWGLAMTDERFLPDSLRNLMTSNQVKDINQNISYGYGWAVFDGKGSYRMGNLDIDKNYLIHGGKTEGYKGMLVVVEDGELVISFLTNTGDQVDEIQLTKRIINTLQL